MREVAHGPLGAVADRLGDLCAQCVELLVGELIEGGEIALPHILAHRGDLDGAEEEAVEDELEYATVLLALGERGGERLAKVALRGPFDLAQDVERVDHL